MRSESWSSIDATPWPQIDHLQGFDSCSTTWKQPCSTSVQPPSMPDWHVARIVVRDGRYELVGVTVNDLHPTVKMMDDVVSSYVAFFLFFPFPFLFLIGLIPALERQELKYVVHFVHQAWNRIKSNLRGVFALKDSLNFSSWWSTRIDFLELPDTVIIGTF